MAQHSRPEMVMVWSIRGWVGKLLSSDYYTYKLVPRHGCHWQSWIYRRHCTVCYVIQCIWSWLDMLGHRKMAESHYHPVVQKKYILSPFLFACMLFERFITNHVSSGCVYCTESNNHRIRDCLYYSRPDHHSESKCIAYCCNKLHGFTANITSSSAIAERPRCTVGQFWPKVEDDILQTI